jgi:hypothetical protein
VDIVLRELDKERLEKNIIINLDLDYINDECETNFKDVVIETIIQTISEIVEKDDWNLQYFDEKESEKLFKTFMENSKIMIRLIKQIDEINYAFDEVIVKFDFSEIERKKIAEIYLENISKSRSYFYGCIINNLKNKDINSISKVLSDEVYGLLSPDEIKMKFKDKLEKFINNK